jgi:hypothetical protein
MASNTNQRPDHHYLRREEASEQHYGEDQSALGSPAHFGSLHGALSPEDIQELLGGVLDDGSDHHDEVKQFHMMGDRNVGHSVPDDTRAAARSERKRSREKQRRSDVNKQFSTLTDLLRQIESSNTDLFAAPVWTDSSFSPTNRVELMARTIHVLQTLERSHKRQKTVVKDLEKQLEVAKKAGEEAAAKAKENMMAPMQAGQNQVVMMVPMLIGGGTTPDGVAGVPSVSSTVATSSMAYMPGPSASTGDSAALSGGSTSSASGMPAAAMPWMMPPTAMAPWGMPMTMAMSSMVNPSVNIAPNGTTIGNANTTLRPSQNSTETPVPPNEESKQPPASESTTTSNLAHCA